ncbi:MAG: hypothetical protein ACK4J1_12825 [Hylemonella sp.]
MSTYHAIVWLDRSEAHVILFDREHIAAQKIKSRSTHKPTGGHGGSHQGSGRGPGTHGHHSPGGGHATADEAYYHAIAESLKGVHEILVTGPAQAKDEFKAHCERHDKDIAKAIVGVVPSDHPSDGQLVAMARQYFLKYDRMQGQA